MRLGRPSFILRNYYLLFYWIKTLKKINCGIFCVAAAVVVLESDTDAAAHGPVVCDERTRTDRSYATRNSFSSLSFRKIKLPLSYFLKFILLMLHVSFFVFLFFSPFLFYYMSTWRRNGKSVEMPRQRYGRSLREQDEIVHCGCRRQDTIHRGASAHTRDRSHVVTNRIKFVWTIERIRKSWRATFHIVVSSDPSLAVCIHSSRPHASRFNANAIRNGRTAVDVVRDCRWFGIWCRHRRHRRRRHLPRLHH